MKINEKIINDIFNQKVKLKNKKDKEDLSKYEDIIPMYDIYTQKIYPIRKENLYFRLMQTNYRFLNEELVKWIKNNYDKYKSRIKATLGEEKQQMESLFQKYKDMIEIIDNYDIDILITNSYQVLYKYSSDLGLSISICKRNSFTPFIYYLKPYYTRTELIKLGQNMGIIKNNLRPEDLIEQETHHQICKKISDNDISFEEIKEHTDSILRNHFIPDIIYYSFVGSMILNNFLRKSSTLRLNEFDYDRLINIVKAIEKSPKLTKDYQIYRFIDDDNFMRNLKVGDIFTDKGFLSTTRDPFYSPGLQGNFGTILIKINLKKNSRGLFIEHFSLFPKEEEYLLPPMSKLKLVSRDDNFKYYHINENFEKAINRKYEFELVGYDTEFIQQIKRRDDTIPTLSKDMLNSEYSSDRQSLLEKLKRSTNSNSEIIILDRIFFVYYYDSLDAYSKFYYNKTDRGVALHSYDEKGNLILLIELGKEMVINYLNKFYFYEEKEFIDENYIVDLCLELGELFGYKTAKVYNTYKNYKQFANNYYKNQEIYLYINMFDETIYNYAKNKIRPFKSESFFKGNFRNLDVFLNEKLTIEIKNRFNYTEGQTVRDLFIDIVEKRFYQYSLFTTFFDLEKFSFGEISIVDKLIAEGKIEYMKNLDYKENDDEEDDIFNIIYKKPLRRL
jgi:hypothetical protein